jgi:hypothetical protein
MRTNYVAGQEGFPLGSNAAVVDLGPTSPRQISVFAGVCSQPGSRVRTVRPAEKDVRAAANFGTTTEVAVASWGHPIPGVPRWMTRASLGLPADPLTAMGGALGGRNLGRQLPTTRPNSTCNRKVRGTGRPETSQAFRSSDVRTAYRLVRPGNFVDCARLMAHGSTHLFSTPPRGPTDRT